MRRTSATSEPSGPCSQETQNHKPYTQQRNFPARAAPSAFGTSLDGAMLLS